MNGQRRTLLIAAVAITAALAAAVAPGTAIARDRASRIKGVPTWFFPNYFQGNSIAVAPDGTPWIGVESEETGPTLGFFEKRSLGLETLPGQAPGGLTTALRFDSAGNLWFGSLAGESSGSIVSLDRRAPDGTVSGIQLPGDEAVTSIAFGPAGQVWFTRSTYGAGAKVGWMAPDEVVTEIALAEKSEPTSIAAGSDGALWLTETGAEEIGRVTTSGEVSFFPVGPGVQPRQIVSGPDGALWFSENGQPAARANTLDRIGRITTSGEVSQFPIRYGTGTDALASDPRGFIWFATDGGEVASIAPDGTLGKRGCPLSCGGSIESLALAPNHSLWFATGSGTCPGCGGGAALLTQIAGTEVGKIPPGRLTPPAAPR